MSKNRTMAVNQKASRKMGIGRYDKYIIVCRTTTITIAIISTIITTAIIIVKKTII